MKTEIVVLIPCFNEEITISKVVCDFKNVLPNAHVYVFDNNSTDKTAELAQAAGATVIRSALQGKGNVVRHMFRVIDARFYLMVDGDDTYPAEFAPRLIQAMTQTGADMVVGARMNSFDTAAFRRFHKFGNQMIAWLISKLFRIDVSDVLSGYRVFSRTFVKSVPLTSEEFEIETELTLQASAKHFKVVEVPIKYGKRPEGSFSKLSTYSDGFLILKVISKIFKDFKPLIFFSIMSCMLALLSISCGMLPILDYIQHQYVYHVPLAILASAFGVLSVLTLGVGLILDSIVRYHAENFELWRRQVKD